jgi:ADP-heptose:LPS heptosyltransferase
MKPKLLIVELWGLGDLAIATPFLRAASEKFDVTLLAKPFAQEMQARFWPRAEVVTFVAPWTAFRSKYRLLRWPWRELCCLLRKLAGQKFDWGLSARWDPRDHILMVLAGVKQRLGFPRLHSRVFLTHPLNRPDPGEHRYEFWRVLAQALELQLPRRGQIRFPPLCAAGGVLVHSGARLPVRVWPLAHYRSLVQRLRQSGHRVQVACDPDQRDWWVAAGEKSVATPLTVTELFGLIDEARLLVGNDSGPGHLAAFCGVPTFTIFGPQLPEWFAPLHPAAEWIEGKACPYKPCSDYCRFAEPRCIVGLSLAEVWEKVDQFVRQNAWEADQPQSVGVRAI